MIHNKIRSAAGGKEGSTPGGQIDFFLIKKYVNESTGKAKKRRFKTSKSISRSLKKRQGSRKTKFIKVMPENKKLHRSENQGLKHNLSVRTSKFTLNDTANGKNRKE